MISMPIYSITYSNFCTSSKRMKSEHNSILFGLKYDIVYKLCMVFKYMSYATSLQVQRIMSMIKNQFRTNDTRHAK